LKQKETISKLGNPLKSKSKSTKSKIGWGASTSTLYQGFSLNENDFSRLTTISHFPLLFLRKMSHGFGRSKINVQVW
jgi:hypothetical protein